MKKHHSSKLHLAIVATAIVACLVSVFIFLKEGVSAMLMTNTTVPYTPIVYTLPDVWYGDRSLPFRISLPAGFVAERHNGETDWKNELYIRTKSDFDAVRTQGSEYGEWRPAITFEMHGYAGAKQTPLQWAKDHFSGVPSNPTIIKVDGRDGIKYTQTINANDRITVYVFNQSLITDNLPTGGSMIAVIATNKVTNAQLNAVMNSLKFY